MGRGDEGFVQMKLEPSGKYKYKFIDHRTLQSDLAVYYKGDNQAERFRHFNLLVEWYSSFRLQNTGIPLIDRFRIPNL